MQQKKIIIEDKQIGSCTNCKKVGKKNFFYILSSSKFHPYPHRSNDIPILHGPCTETSTKPYMITLRIGGLTSIMN